MNKAKRDFATPMIENRASCAYYMGNNSVKLRYLSRILLKTVVEKKKRLLVLQSGPWGVDEMMTCELWTEQKMRLLKKMIMSSFALTVSDIPYVTALLQI